MESLTFLSPFVSPLIEHIIRNLSTLILKPNDVKARLNTVEAYCVYYPIYVSIQRLGVQNLRLIEGLIQGLENDPPLFVKLLPQIGQIGPCKTSINAEVRENFKRNSSLLYLPEPLYKELESEVKNDINRIAGLVKQGNLDDSLKEVERQFKEKYKNGDLQVPGIEDVIGEALVLSISTLKFKGILDYTILKSVVEYYYSVLALERSSEQLSTTLITLLSLFLPAESFSTISEYFKKLQQMLPSSQKVMLNPYIAQMLQIGYNTLGFGYEEFKRTFYETEHLLR